MKKIMYFSVLLFFFSSCKNDGTNIKFRIKNNLGEPISRCYLGHRILKGSNSYLSKSYKVRWNNLEDGELTGYKKIKGKFWGYSNCHLEFYGENKKYFHQSHMDGINSAIDELGLELIPDSIKHPYKDKVIEGERLPNGKYTLTIEGFDTIITQTILVSITKDD